jgi:hypothetical protein
MDKNCLLELRAYIKERLIVDNRLEEKKKRFRLRSLKDEKDVQRTAHKAESDKAFVFDNVVEADTVFLAPACYQTCVPVQTKPLKLKDRLKNLDESFSMSILRIIDERGFSDVDIYKRAEVSKQVFSKLRSQVNYKPQKNTAISLCLALCLNIDEAEKLLKKAGYALSDASVSDIVVRFCFEREIFDLTQVNELLAYEGQSMLANYG